MFSFFTDDPFCFIFDVYGWFSCCYDVILSVNFFLFLFFLFFFLILPNCSLQYKLIFCRNCFHFSRRTQDDERIQKRFILPLLLKPMHNGWHKIILHEWLMDMKNKTILTRQNNTGLLIRLHIEFNRVNRISNFFLLRFTDKNYISLLFLM